LLTFDYFLSATSTKATAVLAPPPLAMVKVELAHLQRAKVTEALVHPQQRAELGLGYDS
jgi:hypothetical protein